jgi:hypothetical protein
MKKALIYARQSAGDEEESASIEAQIEACKSYAAKGYQVVGIYSDANISGKTYPDTEEARSLSAADVIYQNWIKDSSVSTKRRKQYRQGLAEVLKQLGNVDAIILYDFTRLMRPLTDSFLESYIKQLIIKSNTIIDTVRESIIDLTTFSAGLVTTLESRINDNQIAIAKAKSKMQLQRLRDEGYRYTGSNFLGFRSAGRQKVEIVPEEIEVVKEVFKLLNTPLSYMEICRKINEMPQIKRLYTYHDLIKIAKRWEYCGRCLNSKGEVILSKVFPCIIPFADVVSAQQRMFDKRKIHNRDKKGIHPLSGLLYCGVCGGRLTSMKASSHSFIDEAAPVHYYFCKNNIITLKEKKCNLTTIRENFPEDKNTNKSGLILGLLPFVIAHLTKKLNSTTDNSEELAEISLQLDKISRLEKMLDKKYFDGDITSDEYEERFDSYKANKKELQAKKLKLEATKNNTPDTIEQIKQLMDAVESKASMPLALYKQIAPDVFKKIVVFGEYIEVYLIGYDEPVKIERVRIRNTRPLPFVRLDKAPDGHFAFTYIYKSCLKKGSPQAPVSIIYDDGITIIKTIGINPAPYEYLIKRNQHKRVAAAKKNY